MNPASRRVDQPEPGLFKMRLARRGRLVGPWVAALIEFDGKEWSTTINGELVSAPQADPVAARVFDVWHSGVPIDRSEYDFLLQTKAWAEAHAPNHPAANPRKVIDLRTMPPVYQPEGDAV